MALLPESENNIDMSSIVNGTVETSDSYRMQIGNERIKGSVSDIEAMAQACYKILNTERYAYVIYSWGYGVELQDLFGKPIPYVFAVLPTRIREALTYDERVSEVTDFELSNNGGDVLCKFTVKTDFGDLELQKVVNIY